jgi:hypothetical protein
MSKLSTLTITLAALTMTSLLLAVACSSEKTSNREPLQADEPATQALVPRVETRTIITAKGQTIAANLALVIMTHGDERDIDHYCRDTAYLSMPLQPNAEELSDKQTLINTCSEMVHGKWKAARVEGDKLVLEGTP